MDDLGTIAEGIANNLPGVWLAEAGMTVGNHDRVLDGPDGERLKIEHGRGWRVAERDKLVIKGCYPLGTVQFWRPDAPNMEIKVSADKTPAKIAADIRRRLLDVYREELADINQRKSEHDAHEQAKHELLEELQNILGGRSPARDSEKLVHWGDTLDELRVVRPDEVEFRVRLDASEARKLAVWLTENR